MTNNGLRGLEVDGHEKSRMFWTSSWPRCMCMRRTDKAACVCMLRWYGKPREGGAGYRARDWSRFGVRLELIYKGNCTFPEGKEEAVKGNKRMSRHRHAQMVLMRTVIRTKWIQLRSCYSQTSWISVYSSGIYGHPAKETWTIWPTLSVLIETCGCPSLEWSGVLKEPTKRSV